MTEQELRARFENLTLDPASFSHAEHVRLAWTYLSEVPLAEVLKMFPQNLRRFATAAGAPQKYDDRMTHLYLETIAMRIERCGERTSWSRFIEANPDLLRRDRWER
jgi:hypothetical protein